MAKKQKQPKVDEVHLGDIAIDTGTLLMADPVRVGEVADKWEEWATNTDLNQAAIDGTNVINIRKDFGPNNMGVGLALPTGLGDGIYPVLGSYTTTKQFGRRLMSIFIDFSNPFRGSGCANQKPHKITEQCFYGSAEASQ